MKILLLGYYGAKNLGDDMMLYCLGKWLRGQDMDVTVVSESPRDTQERFNLNAVENAPLLFEWGWRYYWGKGLVGRLIRHIRSSDALVVGGGDLIRDDKGWRTFFYTVEKIIVALMFGKPVHLVNIGITRCGQGYSSKILKSIIPRCQCIIARDRGTYEYATELGGKQVMLLPDIAMLLPLHLGVSCAHGRRDNILRVCLRGNPNAFARYPFDDKAVANLAAALDYWIQREAVRVVFTPFQDADERDNDCHKQVLQSMGNNDHAEIEEWNGQLQEIVSRFTASRAVLAMRLHAGVMSVATNTPCAMMPYDRKVREFANIVGIANLLEIDHLHDLEVTKEKIGELLHDVPSKPDFASKAMQWTQITLPR
jgi:polysaccharide pyruvyl transferase CsaB